MDYLEQGLEKLELNSVRVVALLTKYIEEIELFNPAYGLVKVADHRELVVRHILDSLAPLCVIRGLLRGGSQKRKDNWRIADVGSGAGLPGIPLAIGMDDAEFTLIERMGRRAGFLRNTLALLDLPNVCVEEAEMERVAAKQGGSFDIVVFRAFRPLEGGIVKNLLGLLAPDGCMAAYKGRRSVIEEEMENLFVKSGKDKGHVFGEWKIMPVEVPFLEEERHLLVINNGLVR